MKIISDVYFFVVFFKCRFIFFNLVGIIIFIIFFECSLVITSLDFGVRLSRV